MSQLYKQAKSITLLTTILDAILTVLSVLITFLMAAIMKFGSSIISDLVVSIEGIDSESYIAGYEVLGDLFGLGGSTIAAMIVFFLLIVFLIGFVWFLVPSLHGYLTYKKHKDYDTSSFLKACKRDAIVKLIFNAVPLILMIIQKSSGSTIMIAVMIAVCGAEGYLLYKFSQEPNA